MMSDDKKTLCSPCNVPSVAKIKKEGKMNISNRKQIIFILVFFFIALISYQDMQVNNKQLRMDTLAAYQSGGEQGLCDFLNNKNYKNSNQFIVDFTSWSGQCLHESSWNLFKNR